MESYLKLKSEEELILCCARTSLDTEIEIKIGELIDNNVDWDMLITKASYHHLIPLLYLNLKNFEEKVPEDVLDYMQNYFHINARKNLKLMGQLLKIIKVFKMNNISAIPYKGPLLAINIYRNLALRVFDDLDVFFEKDSLPIVKKILIQEGYQSSLKLVGFNELQYMKHQRELKFFNKENINLEAHWKVSSSFSLKNEHHFPLDEYKLIEINQYDLKVFSNEDLLLILSLHAAGHLWSRLSWICDISEMIRNSNELNWRNIVQKAKIMGVSRVLNLNLAIVNDLFPIQLPKFISKEMKSDIEVDILKKLIIKMIFNPVKFNSRQKLYLRYKLRESGLMGIRDIIKILIIPRSNEWKIFERSGPFILIYLFARPLQIINRILE